ADAVSGRVARFGHQADGDRRNRRDQQMIFLARVRGDVVDAVDADEATRLVILVRPGSGYGSRLQRRRLAVVRIVVIVVVVAGILAGRPERIEANRIRRADGDIVMIAAAGAAQDGILGRIARIAVRDRIGPGRLADDR